MPTASEPADTTSGFPDESGSGPGHESADTTSRIVTMVVLHGAIVAVPVLVIALVVGLRITAVLLAVVAGAAVTAWRLRGVDDRIAATLGATPVTAAEEPRLVNLAESVAMAAGVSMPELSVIETSAANAVTWGAGSGPAHLAVTRGLLDTADRVELEAVLGHHGALVRTGTVDAVTIGATLFGPFAKGPLLEPVASLVHAGLDQRSVVLADLDGVRATRYPPGMVAVLARLAGCDTTLATLPPALAGLSFAPAGQHGTPFDLHPPLADRIDLMREI